MNSILFERPLSLLSPPYPFKKFHLFQSALLDKFDILSPKVLLRIWDIDYPKYKYIREYTYIVTTGLSFPQKPIFLAPQTCPINMASL